MSTLAHDTLVELAANTLQSQGCTHICASHISRFPACSQISSHIPDVTAFSGSTLVIVEVESREGLAQAHTAEQWETFHSHASRVGGHFIAVVNKMDELAARALLTQVCGNAANVQVWTL